YDVRDCPRPLVPPHRIARPRESRLYFIADIKAACVAHDLDRLFDITRDAIRQTLVREERVDQQCADGDSVSFERLDCLLDVLRKNTRQFVVAAISAVMHWVWHAHGTREGREGLAA